MTAPISEERARELRALIGDPALVARELGEFSRAASSFSASAADFRRKYPGQWVALHGDQVFAAPSFEAVLQALQEAGIPRAQTIIRFMDDAESVLFF